MGQNRRHILELEKVFQWQVDFLRQIRPGDFYRFAFEHLRLGRGAAAAMILLVFLLSVSAIFIRVIFADRRGQASE